MDEPHQHEVVEKLVAAHNNYSKSYDEVFFEVQREAKLTGSIGKRDIGALMLWKKLRLNSTWPTDLNEKPDKDVRDITGKALKIARDECVEIPEAAWAARDYLKKMKLPGCRSGPTVPSTILTAGAPDRMAVYDRRAVRALARLGCEDPNGSYYEYMKIVCALATQVNDAKDLGWYPRDVDKALWKIGE